MLDIKSLFLFMRAMNMTPQNTRVFISQSKGYVTFSNRV